MIPARGEVPSRGAKSGALDRTPGRRALSRELEIRMKTNRSDHVIHSYDTEQRRVLCGQTEQSNSTKHSREVTCVSCRDLLDHSRARVRLVETHDE